MEKIEKLRGWRRQTFYEKLNIGIRMSNIIHVKKKASLMYCLLENGVKI